MAKLVCSTFIENGSLWLFLDSNLILQNSDTLTIEVDEDEEYVIHWFARGVPGSSYSITISSPRNAQFQLMKAIGHKAKDFGGFQFKK